MAIKVRRGAIADLDTSQLKAGEWVLGTDTINNVGIAKAPSDVVWLATKDDVATAKSKLDPSVSSGVLTFRKPSWKQLVDAPLNGWEGAAIVYNNRIHVFGDQTKHYSFDGKTWQKEADLPIKTSYPITVVYNGEIHIIDNRSGSIGHYSWDGSNWTQRATPSTILLGINNGCLYDGKLTVVSSRYGYASMFRSILQYTDSGGWVNASSTGDPARLFLSCCVYDGLVHYAGGTDKRKRFTWDGTNGGNVQLSDMPYDFYEGIMLTHGGKIHFIGSDSVSTSKKHATWDGEKFEILDDLLYPCGKCPAVSYNGKIYIFGSSAYQSRHKNVFVYG